MPTAVRPAIEALWRLDVTLGGILATGTQPAISQMRLAWWREALQRLDTGATPPAEPVLQALAEHVLPRGVTGGELAGMEDGWLELLAVGPLSEAALDAYAQGRGGNLFGISARLLGGQGEGATEAGVRWALVDFARRGSDPAEARAALALAATFPARAVESRPLGMLASLAQRDVERGTISFERHGSPARMLLLWRYRLTGH